MKKFRRLFGNAFPGLFSVMPLLSSVGVVCLEGNSTDTHLKAAFRLRHKVFVKELNWVSGDGKEERDIYDSYALHFVVYRNEKVIAYVRLTPPGNSFMLENEFQDLLTESDLAILRSRKEETAEVSRLVLRKKLRGTLTGLQINMLLYRAMYQWSRIHGIRFWYMVVTPQFLKNLQKLFPCEAIGVPREYSEGHGVSVAAMLDLQEAEKKVQQEHPRLYQYFRHGATKSG